MAFINPFRTASTPSKISISLESPMSPGQSVHGKVPAAQVLLQTAGELNAVRMAGIAVARFGPEGRNLILVSSKQDCYRSVVYAGRHGTPEELHDLFRRCVAGKVIVRGPQAGERNYGPPRQLRSRKSPQI